MKSNKIKKSLITLRYVSFASFALIVFSFVSACSKKDEASKDQSKVSDVKDAEVTASAFSQYVNSLDGSVIKMLPADTYGFLLFLNTDGVAAKQKEYWEKDLPQEVKSLIDSSLSGFESILNEAGLLKGKKAEDIYTMESAQFISRLKGSSLEKGSGSTQDEVHDLEEESHAGFITRLKLENLQDKAKEIASAVSNKGTPAEVVKEGAFSILEFKDQGAIIPAFRYLGLKDSFMVSASSKEIIETVFEEKRGGLPAIFRDQEFVDLAGQLRALPKSVIFGGLKGAPDKAIPLAFGMSDASFNAATDVASGNDEVLIAFNQTFDSTYAAETRMKISENLKKYLSLDSVAGSAEVSGLKSVKKDKMPSNTIVSLDLSKFFSERLIAQSKEKLLEIEPRLVGIINEIQRLGLSISAVEQQRLLPVPAISFLFEVKNQQVVSDAIKDMVKNSLQSSSMVPPGANWIAEGEDTSTILTALGEEISVISKDQTVILSSAKDMAKLLLSSSVPDSVSSVPLNKLFPEIDSSDTDMGVLFINFKSLSQALEKVFAMSGAFGAKPQLPTGDFNPEVFIKALSSVGLSGARVYLDSNEVLVVDVRTERL